MLQPVPAAPACDVLQPAPPPPPPLPVVLQPLPSALARDYQPPPLPVMLQPPLLPVMLQPLLHTPACDKV